jgi:excisionase family DNA binding protein
MYTVNEVAKIMRVQPLTVRRWIDAGKVKVTQMGKYSTIRISEEELNRLKKGE